MNFEKDVSLNEALRNLEHFDPEYTASQNIALMRRSCFSQRHAEPEG